VLLFFDEDRSIMVAGRQYPFTSQIGIDIVRKQLAPLITTTYYPFTRKESMWSEWHKDKLFNVHMNNNDYHLVHKYIPIGTGLLAWDKLVHDEPDSLMFNDLLKSSCYDPIYSYNVIGQDSRGVGFTSLNQTRIKVGHATKCLCCGKHNITLSNYMICNDCGAGEDDDEYYSYCNCCGARVHNDDVYWVGDDPLCEYCASRETEICDDCGERFYNDELIYDEETNENLCKYCYNRRNR